MPAFHRTSADHRDNKDDVVATIETKNRSKSVKADKASIADNEADQAEPENLVSGTTQTMDRSRAAQLQVDLKNPHRAYPSAQLTKDAAAELASSIGQSCARIETWVKKRREARSGKQGQVWESTDIENTYNPGGATGQAVTRLPINPRRVNSQNIHNSAQPPKFVSIRELPKQPRIEPEKLERRLDMVKMSQIYVLGTDSCQGGCNRAPPQIEEELDTRTQAAKLEFAQWGFCGACQTRVFNFPATVVPGRPRSEERQSIYVDTNGSFSQLSPLATVPVAFPDPQTVWTSPYHLFVAHRFLEPICKNFVRSAPFGTTPDALQKLLNVPELRVAERKDWTRGFALLAMRHVIFLMTEQHPVLAELLVSTGRAKLLCVDAEHESFFDLEGSGGNMVGRILTEKRQQLLVASARDSSSNASDRSSITARAEP